ncbi:MAG: hypothetical protein HRU20_27810 [Pseudomonadales bacterium]|nr:hypothetical protein [Pseudomonadales bacterium]
MSYFLSKISVIFRSLVALPILVLSFLFASAASADKNEDALLLLEIFGNVDFDFTFRKVEYDLNGTAFPGEDSVSFYYQMGDYEPKIVKLPAGDYYISKIATSAYGYSSVSPQYAKKISILPGAANYLGSMKINANLGQNELIQKYYDDSDKIRGKLTKRDLALISGYKFHNLKMADIDTSTSDEYRFKSAKDNSQENVWADCKRYAAVKEKNKFIGKKRKDLEPIYEYLRPMIYSYVFRKKRYGSSVYGEVSFDFFITPDGNVCDAKIAKSELKHKDLENLLLEKFSMINFGKRDVAYMPASFKIFLKR